MIAGAFQKLGQTSRQFLPALLTILYILVSVLIWPLPFVGAVAPSLGLVAVYYWSVHRPDLYRVPVVFLLGMLNDIVHFLPLGLSAFVFVGVHQLLHAQRRFFVGQTFYVLWFGFGLIALLSSFVNWTLLSLIDGRAVTVVPVVMQYLLTVAIFPLAAWVLIRVQRAFLMQG